MPDITKCSNESCPLSWDCWRFNCPPKQFAQPVQKFEPKIYEGKIECDFFIETK